MTCEKFAATIKNRDEEQYQQWVKANAKPCPRCHANIEKNGGCTSVGSQLLPPLRVAGYTHFAACLLLSLRQSHDLQELPASGSKIVLSCLLSLEQYANLLRLRLRECYSSAGSALATTRLTTSASVLVLASNSLEQTYRPTYQPTEPFIAGARLSQYLSHSQHSSVCSTQPSWQID